MKLRKMNWLFAWIGLMALALGCRLLNSSGEDQRPERIIFQDDFSDVESGWNRAVTSNGMTDYADGMYRIVVNQPNTDIWALSGLDLTDTSSEVSALKVGGERDNRFGLICRAVDASNFYTFIISSDGYWGIGKVKGDDYQLLGADALQPTEAIRQGSAINSLRADCVGDTLRFYVNGQKLGEVQDGEFTTGDVGLIAGSYDDAGVDIRFDDFSLRGS